ALRRVARIPLFGLREFAGRTDRVRSAARRKAAPSSSSSFSPAPPLAVTVAADPWHGLQRGGQFCLPSARVSVSRRLKVTPKALPGSCRQMGGAGDPLRARSRDDPKGGNGR